MCPLISGRIGLGEYVLVLGISEEPRLPGLCLLDGETLWLADESDVALLVIAAAGADVDEVVVGDLEAAEAVEEGLFVGGVDGGFGFLGTHLGCFAVCCGLGRCCGCGCG